MVRNPQKTKGLVLKMCGCSERLAVVFFPLLPGVGARAVATLAANGREIDACFGKIA